MTKGRIVAIHPRESNDPGRAYLTVELVLECASEELDALGAKLVAYADARTSVSVTPVRQEG